MDTKGREACLDVDGWNRAVVRALDYAEKMGDTFTILHTIEPFKLYVKLLMKDGRSLLMEMKVTEDCAREFPKCEVLSETVFRRV